MIAKSLGRKKPGITEKVCLFSPSPLSEKSTSLSLLKTSKGDNMLINETARRHMEEAMLNEALAHNAKEMARMSTEYHERSWFADMAENYRSMMDSHLGMAERILFARS